MRNNPSKTPLVRSPRMRILMLIGALLMPACAATQKTESAKAISPTPDLSEQIDYEAEVKGTCIMAQELHNRLLRTDPDKLNKMGGKFWKTLTNCADLDEAEDQIGEGK